ncbi:MAG: twin-arginine translocation signal domain-containing protein [Syntrophaceae bacterium]
MSFLDKVEHWISRRNFLKGVGASLAAAPLISGLSGCNVTDSHSSTTNYNASLVLLGTTGEVSWFQGTARASSSSVLLVDNTMYLIDLGQGSAWRLSQAFNPPDGQASSTFLKRLKAVFFTHIHQDHTADYPSLLLIGPGAGLASSYNPLQVYGPCNRGQLDIPNPNCDYTAADAVSTESGTTTPGLAEMTKYIWQTYAATVNNMVLDNGYRPFPPLIDVHEIGTPGLADPNNTCPETDKYFVYEDDNIYVQATLVNHNQVYPSFAFRFDLKNYGKSVVFSGDTSRNTSNNLQTLAAGTDYLVHEVIDCDWIDAKFPDDSVGCPLTLRQHMLKSHTLITEVGGVAQSCQAKALVLNHIVPGNIEKSKLYGAQQGFSGKLIIGEDLMRIGLA